jgi:DNA-directed RNA polymerase sigma subunit (sigma70/sigma32)
MVLRGAGSHLFDLLDPLERQVITAHYGLDGAAPRTMKELHHAMGLPRTELREALAGGLAKLRISLSE